MAADDDHSIGAKEPRHRLRNRFEVIRKLGHGTYGKVQLAVNKETGQEVISKILLLTRCQGRINRGRTRRALNVKYS